MKMTLTVKTIFAALLVTAVTCGCSGGGKKINVDDNPPPPDTSAAVSVPDETLFTEGPGIPENTQTTPDAEDSGHSEDSEQITVTEPPQTEPVREVSPIEENAIVMTAQSLLGIPFAAGGSSPSEGFDNSGFIWYVLHENGYVNSPRGLHEQAVMGNEIASVSELHSGDLVFFSEGGTKAQFGGIYIGGGIMISCRMPGENVMEFDITSNYYRSNFFKGVRVL